jgi:rhamnosyltransferase
MKHVYGVMSTYNPSYDVLNRIKSNTKDLQKLYIIDDGSLDSKILNQIENAKVEVIRHKQNLGIANALNTGARLALDDGAGWIVFLDQDTTLGPNFVPKLSKIFLDSSKSTFLGILLADLVNESPAIPGHYSPEGIGIVEEGIQSGMMVSAECLEDIGFLDESLFIDCVDTEFCLRAVDSGWRVGIATGSMIEHTIGTNEIFSPFFKMKTTPTFFQYHKPFRQYYIVRNNTDLCLRNLFKRPKWVLSVARREFSTVIIPIIGGPTKFRSLIASLIGLFHGLIRKRGRIPSFYLRLFD